MQHKYTPKCWARSVIESFTVLICLDTKRLCPLSIFAHLQAFVLHARHATFYLFYAKFPNKYLQDIVRYGAEYKQHVPNQPPVIIQQSEPFRMRYPAQQVACFKLLSKLFYYMVSGESKIGYLAKAVWNPYCQEKAIFQVSRILVLAHAQKHQVYDCITVQPHRTPDEILLTEGELDNESEASDFDDYENLSSSSVHREDRCKMDIDG